MSQVINEAIKPLFSIIDTENGKGYNKNISPKGFVVKMPNSQTQMLYTVRFIPVDGDDIKVLKINYIHYEKKEELLTMIAWATKWWSSLKPNLIIYREKDRNDKNITSLLKKCGFLTRVIKPRLKEFDCNIDHWPCKCKVFEDYAYAKLKDEK